VNQEGVEIFAPFPGRLMKEYVSLPEAIIQDTKALRRWMRRSLEYAAALPAKGARRAAPRAAKKSAAPEEDERWDLAAYEEACGGQGSEGQKGGDEAVFGSSANAVMPPISAQSSLHTSRRRAGSLLTREGNNLVPTIKVL
jgi:hypothetical protein